MKVVIVGGGVAGLFTAFYLIQEGVDVAVVDQGDPGSWSRAAAGALEFTRFDINKITVRSYPKKYLSMMLRGDARIKTWDWRWIFEYVKKWGKEPPGDMWEAVKALGEFSRRQYRSLAEAKNDFDYAEEPLYEVGIDVDAALEEARRDPLMPRVDVGECCGKRALVYLDAVKISTDLATERLLKELRGVQFVKRRSQVVAGNEVQLEGGGVLKADAVVVAAGYWARKLGVPVAPFKGYGFRTNAKAEKLFADMSKGIFVVPLSRWTKVTGRFDLDGSDDHSPAQKVLQRAREVLGNFEVIDMAVGYRPCTPDGFPVVDKIGAVAVVTGACRLGWTFGPALGRLAADLALGKKGVDALSMARFR
jgi:D-proline dehydrogenase